MSLVVKNVSYDNDTINVVLTIFTNSRFKQVDIIGRYGILNWGTFNLKEQKDVRKTTWSRVKAFEQN